MFTSDEPSRNQPGRAVQHPHPTEATLSAPPTDASHPRPAPPAGYQRHRHGIHLLHRPETIADPRAYIDAVRELPSLWWDPTSKVWVCTGYEIAARILRDHQHFRTARLPDPARLAAQGLEQHARLVDILARQMLFVDGSEHQHIRQALQPAFTAHAVTARARTVRCLVDELVTALPRRGIIDLVSGLAAPLPARLIAALLALPARPELVAWADAYERLLSSLTALPSVEDADVIATLTHAFAVLREVAKQRHGQPATSDSDLITLLVNGLAPHTPEGIDALLDRTAANALVLLVGGYQTLTQTVAMGLLRLAQHPDELAAVRADPGLAGAVVAEVMRLDGSSQYLARRAVADIDLAGTTISRGQSVVLLVGAANRDPRQFGEPARFNPRRRDGHHLGLGLGRHHCLGAADAQQAAQLAITAFLARYGHYSIAPAEGALRWGPHPNTRAPHTLLLNIAETSRSPRRPEPGPHHAHKDQRPTSTATTADTGRHDALAAAVALAGPVVDLSGEPLWMHAVSRIAGQHPDAVAIHSPRHTLRYNDLDRAARVLATRLRRDGVEPGHAVAIVMDRHATSYLAALAIAHTGAAFLTAEPTCPPRRLHTILAEARVSHVCTLAHNATRVAAQLPPTTRLMVLDPVELMRAPDPGEVISGVRPGDNAYLVFTSGTTGTPKAIGIDHDAVRNLAAAQRHVYQPHPDDRVLQWFSPSFDGWCFDLMLALTSGATLVPAPAAATHCLGPQLKTTLGEQAITIATLTPSAWHTLTDTSNLDTLRIAACAGEICTRATVRLLTGPTRRHVLNLYGPAETAVWATFHDCHPDDPHPPIGTPIPNKTLHLLDEHATPVEPGTTGQLWIGGTGIGRYLQQPELTATRFAPDPAASRPDQLMYATGDLCRQRPDGTLVFIGRTDRQVKIRGQRVELDEIEHAILTTIPDITHAAVTADNGTLTATVVTAHAPHFDTTAARQRLSQHLHPAMIPTRFTVEPAPTLGATGKLRTPTAPHVADTNTSTRSPISDSDADIEHTRLVWTVAGCIASVLDLPHNQVKTTTDFINLGGDSLTVVDLLARIRHHTGANIDLATLLDTATPQTIATAIQIRGHHENR